MNESARADRAESINEMERRATKQMATLAEALGKQLKRALDKLESEPAAAKSTKDSDEDTSSEESINRGDILKQKQEQRYTKRTVARAARAKTDRFFDKHNDASTQHKKKDQDGDETPNHRRK